NLPGADLNVACDGPSGRGPWMGRVIRSQHINNLKYEGYITGKKPYRPGKSTSVI
ncbi:hypothetical protein B4V85_004275, partial [Salmonella enterica subsp. enterica serovar Typhi]|nr:hypothetical protein [Salmonella enterica subsp. enterica serovar Typhi]EEC1636202.1 hypothetical protein [Salmonella enterica subsp. enterica serovar Typhi]EEM0810183.1 hypothetical protein [Salmonella enterica subsp. enterica serovar Typhi]EEM1469120.1 hypothetical protein [Salmonella enterica subsp. enterica serovar Typhi]EEO3971670.1 hypothetical protein [Salmonella enterica]